jgi:tellurite resistance protein TerC
MSMTLLWIIFNLFVLGMLALDLGVFHRKSHEVSVKEAVGWTVVWVTLALLFNGLVYAWKGPTVALEFLTGYLIEKSLSVDNIFVFLMVFSYFNVPKMYQHGVLFWGVLGALLMRALLIGVGAALISRFHWIIYLFGAFLIFTGIKMGLQKDEAIHPDDNPVVKWVRKVMPVSGDYHGSAFLIREGARWVATPLLLVLVMVETTDVIFAFDSIPAIFAVSRDPFIVYTSNVFAILGLRALYFLLAGVMDQFRFLKLGLAAILTFVGGKMLAGAAGYHMAITHSLLVILAILTVAIVASLLFPARTVKAQQAKAEE